MPDRDKSALLKKLNNKYLNDLHGSVGTNQETASARPAAVKRVFNVGTTAAASKQRKEAPLNSSSSSSSSIIAKKRNVQKLLAERHVPTLRGPTVTVSANTKHLPHRKGMPLQLPSNKSIISFSKSMSSLSVHDYYGDAADDDDKERIHISNTGNGVGNTSKLSFHSTDPGDQSSYRYSNALFNPSPLKPPSTKLHKPESSIRHSSPPQVVMEWELNKTSDAMTLDDVLRRRRYPGPSQVELIRKAVLGTDQTKIFARRVTGASEPHPEKDVYVSDQFIFNGNESFVDYSDVLESSRSRSAETLYLRHCFRRFCHGARSIHRGDKAILFAFSREVRNVILMQSGMNKLLNHRSHMRRLWQADRHHHQSCLVEAFVRLFKIRPQYSGRSPISNIPYTKAERVKLLRLYLWKTEVSSHYQQFRTRCMLRNALCVYKQRLSDRMVGDARYRRGRRWHGAVVQVHTLVRLKRLVSERRKRRSGGRGVGEKGIAAAALVLHKGVMLRVWRRWLDRFVLAMGRSIHSSEGLALAREGHLHFHYNNTLAKFIAHQIESGRRRQSNLIGKYQYLKGYFEVLRARSAAAAVAWELAILAEHSYEIYHLRRALQAWLRLAYEGTRSRRIRSRARGGGAVSRRVSGRRPCK